MEMILRSVQTIKTNLTRLVNYHGPNTSDEKTSPRCGSVSVMPKTRT